MLRRLWILALCVACGSTKKPATLTVDRDHLDFATTAPGDTSAEAAVHVTNPGGQSSEPVVVSLSGSGPAGFVITSDACRGVLLAPGASCELRLAFRPSEEGQFAAEVRVEAGPAAATVSMAGRAEAILRLSLSSPDHSFLGVEVGQAASTFVTVTNAGPGTTVPLTFDASGDTGSYLVGGNCIGRTLAAGASCDLRVTFAPQGLGPKALALAIRGSTSATVRATFSGYGKKIVVLTVAAEGDGQVAVSGSAAVCSDLPCQLRFEIGGPAAQATLSATAGNGSMFAGWAGDCSGSSPSCEVSIDGNRSVLAKFVPAVRLSIRATSVAGGQGFVQQDLDSCQVPCTLSKLIRRGSSVRLAAGAATGSQFRWSATCAGTSANCDLTAGADLAVEAIFNGANYVFVTSQAYRTDLGLEAYDRACNERARAGGLPGGYLAWLSTTKTDAVTRFSSARGFIRVDGRPFADVLGPGAPVFFPPALDEYGVASTPWPSSTMTGSDENGGLVSGANCSDWTVSGAYALRLGNTLSGSSIWTGWGWSSCQTSWAIFCLGIGIDRPLQRERAAGRIAFVTSSVIASGGGLAAADSLCSGEARAAGLPGSFKALLAAEGASAASRFDLRGAPWVRPDGVPIVEKAADLDSGKILAPIDVSASGKYLTWGWTWTGARTPMDPGTSATTCSSWKSQAADLYALWGSVSSSDPTFWFGVNGVPCNGWYSLYCLQE